MLTITDKTKCCGCSACFNICPKEAIKMEYDSEGFLYPQINNTKCIKCELCLKVCPILNNKKENKVLEVFGAKNKNIEEQLKSSSGGMFSIFANYVLEQNGIVFGATFDKNWNVFHKYIDNKEDLDCLRRSKYIQSDINTTYKQAKQFLDNNKLVLFVGTPCQIAGLMSFLRKTYENLITIDFICHGTPSPKVLEKFLNDNFDKQKIKKIDFRDKEIGWMAFFDNYYLVNGKNKSFIKNFIKKIKNKNLQSLFSFEYLHSPFFKGFLRNLFSRPVCYKCFCKNIERDSDFTVGDLWGIEHIIPKLYDKKGVSVVTVNSQKAKNIFEKIKSCIEYEKISYSDMTKYNPVFLTSVPMHPKREEFFKKYQSENLNKLIPELLNEKTLFVRLFNDTVNSVRKAIRTFFRNLLNKVFN